MKLKKALFLTAALSLTLCTSVSAYPARVWSLGEYVPYTAPPFMSEDKSTLMVPMRATLEYFNASAQTNLETGEIVASSGQVGSVFMKVGSEKMIVNGQEKTLPAAPIVIDDQMFVPLKAIAECLDYGIGYDKNRNFANIGVAVSRGDNDERLIAGDASNLDVNNEYPSMSSLKDVYHVLSSQDGYLYELKGHPYNDMYRVLFNFRVVDGKVVQDYTVQVIDEPNLSEIVKAKDKDGNYYQGTLGEFFEAIELLDSSYSDEKLHYLFGDIYKEYDKYKGNHKDSVESTAQQYMQYLLPQKK